MKFSVHAPYLQTNAGSTDEDAIMAKLLFNGTSIFGHDGPTIQGYRTLLSCVSKHDGREHYRVIGPPVPIQKKLVVFFPQFPRSRTNLGSTCMIFSRGYCKL